MSTEPSSRPIFSQQLILSPLFTGLRGRVVLRTSQTRSSKKFTARERGAQSDAPPFGRLHSPPQAKRSQPAPTLPPPARYAPSPMELKPRIIYPRLEGYL